MGGTFFQVRDVLRTDLEQAVKGILLNLETQLGLSDVRVCEYVYSEKWQDWTCYLWVHA